MGSFSHLNFRKAVFFIFGTLFNFFHDFGHFPLGWIPNDGFNILTGNDQWFANGKLHKVKNKFGSAQVLFNPISHGVQDSVILIN